MQIGRRIYYELATGNVIVDTGERQGAVVPTTIEQDFTTYAALAQRVPETVGVLELEFGQYAEDFAACSGYRIPCRRRSGRMLLQRLKTTKAPPDTGLFYLGEGWLAWIGPFSFQLPPQSAASSWAGLGDRGLCDRTGRRTASCAPPSTTFARASMTFAWSSGRRGSATTCWLNV